MTSRVCMGHECGTEAVWYVDWIAYNVGPFDSGYALHCCDRCFDILTEFEYDHFVEFYKWYGRRSRFGRFSVILRRFDDWSGSLRVQEKLLETVYGNR